MLVIPSSEMASLVVQITMSGLSRGEWSQERCGMLLPWSLRLSQDSLQPPGPHSWGKVC